MARILDLGAGHDPDPAATDAVELLSRAFTVADAKRVGQTIPPRVNYLFGVDMNKGLPYDASTFQKVISKYAISAYGKPKAYREAYRVLKPGGTIVVELGDPRDIQTIATRLRGARFTGVTVKEQTERDYYGKKHQVYQVLAKKGSAGA
jgi:ubiquinone/menaquinone biosynthesis C-methylase UbiE